MWTSVFDLAIHAVVGGVRGLLAAHPNAGLTATLLLGVIIRMATATVLVSTVVGLKEALLGLCRTRS
ncbi:MAG: hypothetical protein ABR592_05765 [Nitriliruptorales bacterium]